VKVDRLREDDVEAALSLSGSEGWNQSRADWRRLLHLQPDGCFAARRDARLVATVTTVAYGRELAWIGMMMVDRALRGQGIGRALMRIALNHLRVRGIQTVKLDATPAGRPLYESLGFIAEAELERWQGGVRREGLTGTAASDLDCAELEMFDRGTFGADRSRLLRRLVAEACGPPVVAREAGGIKGYALARQGLTGNYVGPIMANEKEIAVRLLNSTLARFCGAQICLDVVATGPLGQSAATAHGLASVRKLTRMAYGEAGSAAVGHAVCASAGPEYG
jgi:predicted N-acetyltransferase YhbS